MQTVFPSSVAISVGAIVATASLLLGPRFVFPLLSFEIGQIPVLDFQFKYQLWAVFLAFLMLTAIRLVLPDKFRTYVRLGKLDARAGKDALFGIRQGDSWKRTGLRITVVVTLVTTLALWLKVWTGYEGRLAWDALWLAPLFAASNTFAELILMRLSLVTALDGVIAPNRIATLSGMLFGVFSMFTMPGGLFGLIAGGTLGYFFTRSILETKGLFWASFIQFVQSNLIFATVVLLG